MRFSHGLHGRMQQVAGGGDFLVLLAVIREVAEANLK